MKKGGSKLEQVTLVGKPTVATKADDWEEKVWDFTAGSIASSIFSFGIAAVAGCNLKTVKRIGETSYSKEEK